jgi:Sec-independent protein translocase protein TatA
VWLVEVVGWLVGWLVGWRKKAEEEEREREKEERLSEVEQSQVVNQPNAMKEKKTVESTSFLSSQNSDSNPGTYLARLQSLCRLGERGRDRREHHRGELRAFQKNKRKKEKERLVSELASELKQSFHFSPSKNSTTTIDPFFFFFLSLFLSK